MPDIRLTIHITLPWCSTVVHTTVPAGTPVRTVLADLDPLTRGTECLAVRQGKALLGHTALHEDTEVSVVPLLGGG